MLDRVRNLFFQGDALEGTSLTREPRMLIGRVRAADETSAIRLDLGERSLRLYPDRQLNGERPAARDWILVDDAAYLTKICGFLRIARGEKKVIGRGDETCQRLFAFSRSVRKRQLEIANDDGRVTITRLDPGGETYLSRVEDEEQGGRSVRRRLASLKAIRRIFGGPIALLPPDQALETLRKAKDILREEAYRPRDMLGRPGGLLNLPDDALPVVVGDLHANLDNLLKVASENACLDSLRQGEACLVILGDAVHPEGDRDLSQMDSSLLMLDMIFKLKIRFPGKVFYLRGNHDSFDEWVGKAGVPQGILLKKRAQELRGQTYTEELSELFELLPYVVRHKHFIACHGGPPRSDTTLPALVNIRTHHRLAQELIWNRVRRPNHPGGYGQRHVNAFRSTLGVNADTPFIVGHTPLSPQETLWLDIGNIRGHHIVYSAHAHNLSMFVRAGEGMVPLVYPAEALLDLTNALPDFEQEPATLAC